MHGSLGRRASSCVPSGVHGALSIAVAVHIIDASFLFASSAVRRGVGGQEGKRESDRPRRLQVRMGWISAPRRQVAGPLQQRGAAAAAAARREPVAGALEAGWSEGRGGFEIGCRRDAQRRKEGRKEGRG